MTRTALAALTGFNWHLLTRIEQGRRLPTPVESERLELVLGTLERTYADVRQRAAPAA